MFLFAFILIDDTTYRLHHFFLISLGIIFCHENVYIRCFVELSIYPRYKYVLSPQVLCKHLGRFMHVQQ
nr:MAG TPA: hypothetical protein [Caudoviricetes sp.]